jgi:hypothetical protein
MSYATLQDASKSIELFATLNGRTTASLTLCLAWGPS